MLADYEREFARLLVRSGVSAVLGHQHHTLRGVELVQGVPVFYGLGHFVFDMPGLEQKLGEAAMRRLEAAGDFAIYARPGYPLLPFHPEARLTAIAALVFDGPRLSRAGLVPCLIDSANCSRIDPEGRVLAYLHQISEQAQLSVRYELTHWNGEPEMPFIGVEMASQASTSPPRSMTCIR